jgi:heme A synthase
LHFSFFLFCPVTGGSETLITSAALLCDAPPSSNQSVKRKPKKKAAANHQDLPHADLETVLEGLHARAFPFHSDV